MNTNLHHIRLISLFFFIFQIIIAGCSDKLTPVIPIDDQDLLKKSSQILFLTLKAKKIKSENNININIIHSALVDGKMKYIEHGTAQEELSGSWKISLTDAKNRILTSAMIDNPFSLNKEIFNPDGTIQTKHIEIDEVQIPIRFPFVKQMKKIQIDTINSFYKTIQIYQQAL